MLSMTNSSSITGNIDSIDNIDTTPNITDGSISISSSSSGGSDQHFDNATIQSQAGNWLQTGSVHMLATHSAATMSTTLTSSSGVVMTTESDYKLTTRHDNGARSRIVAGTEHEHNHNHNHDHDHHHERHGNQHLYNRHQHYHQHDASERGLVRDGNLRDLESSNDHHMPMVFHARAEEVILFDFWHTKRAWHMVVSCLVVILLGIIYEGIKFYREWLFKQRASRSAANNRNNNNSKKQTAQRNKRATAGRSAPTFEAFNFSRRTLGGALPPQPSQSQQSQQSQQSMQSRAQSSSQLPPQPRWTQPSPTARETEVERAISPRRETDICSMLHFAQTFLHIVQVALGFILMLIFMTFNVWLCMAVVFGAAIGYFLFFWRLQRINLEHCI